MSGRGRKSGGGSVSVSGYTRKDGTVVSGYTRSAPSRSNGGTSSGCGSSGAGSQNIVHVSGYTRKDGTKVSGYTRSAPSRSSDGTATGHGSSGAGSQNIVQVSGYTRKDGTKVSGYTRSAPSRSSGGTSGLGHNTSGDVKPPMSTKSGTSSEGQGLKYYADNAYNRKLGRVGKPIGSHVAHQDGTITKSGGHFYKDNAKNRCLGRVGKPIKNWRRNLIEENELDDLSKKIESIKFTLESMQYRYIVDYMQRKEVEEEWRNVDIDPSTDTGKLPLVCSGKKCIAFHELELGKCIGRGGFSEVYAGLWHKTPIAYKKFLMQRMSKKLEDRFVNEVTVSLSTLDHPNTVCIFGAVVDEANKGIVMEYLTRSLFQAIHVDEIEISDDEKNAIVSQTVSALVYLHSKSISHGDIKSENVLLDAKNNAKLGDFGLSIIRSTTASSRSCPATPGQGTPRYSAPEVLRGEILDMEGLCLADIYSLAVLVFEILAEEEPFVELTVRQLEREVGEKGMCPTTSTRFSKAIDDLLNSCWDRNPAQRPTACQFQLKWSNIKDLYHDDEHSPVTDENLVSLSSPLI